MASNEVWGIDIGKSGIKAVKMRRNKDQVEILGIEIIEYEQASEAEDVDKEEQVRQALIEFQARNKIKNEKIFVSIPGQATFNRMITIPPVEAKRIKEIVTYEAQQQIPFPIDEVLWDYQLIGDKDKVVEEREVMLFAVRREIINNFLANLSAAQISVSGIQIAPLAIYNFIRYECPELEACVAIDIGAENTDLVVVDSEKLWLRALPSAGNDITKALQKRFNIPYGEAEKLKVKSGKTKQSRKIFEVMKPVLKDIVGEIHRSVGYYKSMAKDIKFEKMFFLGNVTKLSGFENFFTQNLQYNIQVLSELQRVRVSSKINLNLFQTNITTFAVAMGLAIQGLGLSINNIRLLPEEVWRTRALEKQKPVLALSVALLAAIPIYQWYTNSTLLNSIQKSNKEVKKILKPIAGAFNELKSVQKYGDLVKQSDALCSIGVHREIWLSIIKGINEVYQKAAVEISKKKQPKIWILDLNATVAKANISISKKESISLPYITTSFKVAFRSLGDQVKTRAYIVDYLRKPLGLLRYQGRDLFDSRRGAISIEMKDVLFPGEAPREETYCHVVLKLDSWVNSFHLFTSDSKYQSELNDGNCPDELRKQFAKYKCSLSEFVSVKSRSDSCWEITEKGQTYILKKTNEGLHVYKMR